MSILSAGMTLLASNGVGNLSLGKMGGSEVKKIPRDWDEYIPALAPALYIFVFIIVVVAYTKYLHLSFIVYCRLYVLTLKLNIWTTIND